MDELAKVPEFHYHLGLHEGAAVSMADGYARATGRPAFLNLHIAAGLAHGLANMLNARRARTPLVVTVGQQDRRHLIHDPMLGGDLLALAQGAFKDAVEVNQVADLPTLIRRAFLLSQTAPTGPVMVSIPVDVLEEELDDPLPARTDVRGLAVAEGVEDLPRPCSGQGLPRSSPAMGSGAPAPSRTWSSWPSPWAPPSFTSRCTTASTSRPPIRSPLGCCPRSTS
jgi:benzoylformate decarboxylase